MLCDLVFQSTAHVSPFLAQCLSSLALREWASPGVGRLLSDLLTGTLCYTDCLLVYKAHEVLNMKCEKEIKFGNILRRVDDHCSSLCYCESHGPSGLSYRVGQT